MAVNPYTRVLRHRARVRVALCWLLAGSATLLLTPLDAWTPLLGWAPMLMLVISPLLVLLALQPSLPLRLLASCMSPRRRMR